MSTAQALHDALVEGEKPVRNIRRGLTKKDEDRIISAVVKVLRRELRRI